MLDPNQYNLELHAGKYFKTPEHSSVPPHKYLDDSIPGPEQTGKQKEIILAFIEPVSYERAELEKIRWDEFQKITGIQVDAAIIKHPLIGGHP